MIQSMTGFGAAFAENSEIKVDVESKSLNSKFLDLNLRLPRLVQSLEMEVRNLVSKKLKRGKVNLNINIQLLDISQAKRGINAELFKSYLDDINNIIKDTQLDASNIIPTILNLPDVLENNENNLSETAKSTFLDAIEKSLDQLIEFRKDEGKALEQELLSYSSVIRENLNKIDANKQTRIEKLKQKLQELHDKHLSPEHVDSGRFEQELVYYLEKLDITEEIVRLNGHLNYYEKELNKEASGKKLQFIAQEMGREINTIGSKANDEQIQHLVVEMKEELEKIKEQVLNIL